MANGTKTSTPADSGAKFSEKTGGAYADMTAVIQSELNRVTGGQVVAGDRARLIKHEGYRSGTADTNGDSKHRDK